MRIDRRRKLPATVLIRALGAVPDTAKKNPLEFKGSHRGDPQLLLRHRDHLPRSATTEFEKSVELELLPGQRATRDIKTKTGEVIVKKNRKFTRAAIKKLEAAKMKTLPIDADELFTKVSAYDVVDENTGEVILECNEEVTAGEGRRASQARDQGVQGPLHRQPQRGSVPA